MMLLPPLDVNRFKFSRSTFVFFPAYVMLLYSLAFKSTVWRFEQVPFIEQQCKIRSTERLWMSATCGDVFNLHDLIQAGKWDV